MLKILLGGLMILGLGAASAKAQVYYTQQQAYTTTPVEVCSPTVYGTTNCHVSYQSTPVYTPPPQPVYVAPTPVYYAAPQPVYVTPSPVYAAPAYYAPVYASPYYGPSIGLSFGFFGGHRHW